MMTRKLIPNKSVRIITLTFIIKVFLELFIQLDLDDIIKIDEISD